MFTDGAIIQGEPEGMTFTTATDPRSDFLSGKTATIVRGVFNSNNLNKVDRAGGYMIEMMKYIGQASLQGNGSTRMMGEGLNAMELIFHEQANTPSTITNLNQFDINYYNSY